MRPLHELLIEAANRQRLAPATRRGVLTLAGAVATVPVAHGIESVRAQVSAEKQGSKKMRSNAAGGARRTSGRETARTTSAS